MLGIVVALRKESVDRNWYCLGTRVSETLVALRKESVDRNTYPYFYLRYYSSRSPQGERG